MKTILSFFYGALVAVICLIGGGCNQNSQTSPAVGRYQYHDSNLRVVFDTATGRIYFIGSLGDSETDVRDPVLEASKNNQPK